MTARVSPGRQVALATLLAVARGRLLDRAFDAGARGLDDRERRWARECAYGVLRHRGRLDHLLSLHVRRGLDCLDPPVLELLRMGAHQLVHMSGVPAYAAVSQTVEAARAEAGRGAAGLVNGVLRAVQRGGLDRTRFPGHAGDPAGYLSTWHSHPAWLVERWRKRWPDDRVEALLEANNRVPPVYLRPLGTPPEEAVRRLSTGTATAAVAGPCVALPRDLGPTEALDRVRGVIQDPGAAMVTDYADFPSSSTVADLCAAPGGKAVALAERVRYVVAADRSAARMERLARTLERLGSPVGMVVARAEAPPLAVARGVLLDVPCSGTGTLRRHPDLKWRLGLADLASLVELQAQILEGAAAVVPEGGLLVYSTCTLEPEENEEQVKAFLERHPDFALEASGTVDADLLVDGALTVLPHRTGFDGAFAARMRRGA